MVGASLGPAGRYEPYRLICRWLNVKKPGRCAPLGSTGDGCCTWLFHIKQKHFIQQHPFLSSNIQHSTFHHLANQTIRQSDIRPEACGASFQTKKLRTFACFPVSPQRGINYPPSASADGPPFLSRKELRFASFPCVSFSVLKFYKGIFLFTPAICKDCTVPRIRSGFLLSKDKVLSLLATSLLNRNPYGFPINGSPVF